MPALVSDRLSEGTTVRHVVSCSCPRKVGAGRFKNDSTVHSVIVIIHSDCLWETVYSEMLYHITSRTVDMFNPRTKKSFDIFRQNITFLCATILRVLLRLLLK